MICKPRPYLRTGYSDIDLTLTNALLGHPKLSSLCSTRSTKPRTEEENEVGRGRCAERDPWCSTFESQEGSGLDTPRGQIVTSALNPLMTSPVLIWLWVPTTRISCFWALNDRDKYIGSFSPFLSGLFPQISTVETHRRITVLLVSSITEALLELERIHRTLKNISEPAFIISYRGHTRRPCQLCLD